MKIFAVNGSPRKNFNTAQLLKNFIDGVKSYNTSAETEIINLYDYNFKGCYECYLCKMKNGKYYGKCGYKDEITDLLDKVAHSDGIMIGSPIFFGDMNAQTKAFIERLLYPFKQFTKNGEEVIPPKKLYTGFIHPMNVSEDFMKEEGYFKQLKRTYDWFEYIFGYKPEILNVYFTKQYKDYSRYVSDFWDVEAKEKQHEEQFPVDCCKAFELGKKMADNIFREKEDIE